MIEDSAKRAFQYVIVYQLDRFARNRYDSATYKARLKKNGVRVLSARENITDDASGILVEGLLESMAEYYSAELAQKIRRGMDLNAEKCLCTGGNVALGFKVGPDKHFLIDEETAPIVQKIFELYASGQTVAQICETMNAQGVKTSRAQPSTKTACGRCSRTSAILASTPIRIKRFPAGCPVSFRTICFIRFRKRCRKTKRPLPAPKRNKSTF